MKCVHGAVRSSRLSSGRSVNKTEWGHITTLFPAAVSSFRCFVFSFHRKFAPRCCVCHEPIMPAPGQEETVRIVALDRDFHVQCYRCEVCSLCVYLFWYVGLL